MPANQLAKYTTCIIDCALQPARVFFPFGGVLCGLVLAVCPTLLLVQVTCSMFFSPSLCTRRQAHFKASTERSTKTPSVLCWEVLMRVSCAGCIWGDKDEGDNGCVIKKTCFLDCFNPVSNTPLSHPCAPAPAWYSTLGFIETPCLQNRQVSHTVWDKQ